MESLFENYPKARKYLLAFRALFIFAAPIIILFLVRPAYFLTTFFLQIIFILFEYKSDFTGVKELLKLWSKIKKGELL